MSLLNDESKDPHSNAHRKMVDTKIPLYWLIGSAIAIVFSMGIAYAKLDSVAATQEKMLLASQSRDSQINTLQSAIAQTQGVNSNQDIRLNRFGSDMEEVRKDIRQLQEQRRSLE